MLTSQAIAAGGMLEFQESGNFFRLLATGGDVTIRFYRKGAQFADAVGVSAGYAETFGEGFDKITIESVTAQTVKFAIRLGSQIRFDMPPQGNVSVTNFSGSVVQSKKTVTNAAGDLLAANPARRYLLIQNNDAAGVVFINFSGAATAANGLKIAPGGNYTADASFCPVNAISAIGSIASNANVIVVEG